MSGKGCRVPTTARTGTPSGMSVQTDAPICPFALLPGLQKRDGGLSPHARSVTPARFFLLGGWCVCSTRRADFARLLPVSPSHARWEYFNSFLVFVRAECIVLSHLGFVVLLVHLTVFRTQRNNSLTSLRKPASLNFTYHLKI